MARSRKPSDKSKPEEEKEAPESKIEDAVVIEDSQEPAAPATRKEIAESDRPEDVEAAEDQNPAELTAEGSDAAEDGTAKEEAVDPETADQPEGAKEEDTAQAEPSRTTALPVAPAPVATASGTGGAIALVFGGIIAGLIGFAASRYVFPAGSPEELERLQASVSAIEASIGEVSGVVAEQAQRVNEVAASVTALEASLAASNAATEAVAADAAASAAELQNRLSMLETDLSAVSSRLEDLALRPIPEGLDTASLNAEVAEFRAELSAAVEEARAGIVAAQEEAAAIAAAAAEEAAAKEAAAAAEAEALRAAAEAEATRAMRDAAAARIAAAIENGEPYASDLGALDGTDIPQALSAPAETGVSTLVELQQAFPEAARAALDASIRAEVGETALDRFTAFLRVQSGARSLEPREGDDPDAVLSRAEAALRSGDISGSLSQLETLPESGRTEMATWIAMARARLEAQAAAAAIAGPRNSN